MKKALTFALTLIFMLSSVTAGFAEENLEASYAHKAGITPDSVLYPIDVALDNLKVFLTIGDENKVIAIVSVAEERLGESEVMLEKGNEEKAMELLQEYNEKMQEAYEKLEAISQENQEVNEDNSENAAENVPDDVSQYTETEQDTENADTGQDAGYTDTEQDTESTDTSTDTEQDTENADTEQDTEDTDAEQNTESTDTTGQETQDTDTEQDTENTDVGQDTENTDTEQDTENTDVEQGTENTDTEQDVNDTDNEDVEYKDNQKTKTIIIKLKLKYENCIQVLNAIKDKLPEHVRELSRILCLIKVT